MSDTHVNETGPDPVATPAPDDARAGNGNGSGDYGADIVTAEGQPVTYGRAFGRYFGKLLSGMILGIGMVGPFILTLLEADHFWIANAIYLVFVMVGAVKGELGGSPLPCSSGLPSTKTMRPSAMPMPARPKPAHQPTVWPR